MGNTRGKNDVPTSNVSRQALGEINQLNTGLARRNAQGGKGSGEKKHSSKSRACSTHQPTVEEVEAPPHSPLLRAELPASDNCTPGTYNPFAIINAPAVPPMIRDVDTSDHHNPQLVSEYINEIYIYLRRLERQQPVRPDYMAGYAITPRMRAILVDWLVQVHTRFGFLQETLYLTISIIDRYLQIEEVNKSKLQLVGVTAMWIASKYEETLEVEVADFVYITDNSYTTATMRQMERRILKKLEFNLGRPLPLHFLRRYSKVAEVDSMRHTLAKYLLELSILDYHLVHYHPSEISAASLCLSIELLDEQGRTSEPFWNETLAFYSTYSQEHLNPIMYRLALLVYKSPVCKQKATRHKYKSSKFMQISTLEELQSVLIEDYAARAKDVS
ncbi:G2/mitotic-specific cyclin-B2-like isoform X2 [Watersipora subatra]